MGVVASTISLVKTFRNHHCVRNDEGQSGPASSISLTEVKLGCVRSETRWATLKMKDKTAHSAVLRKES